MAEGVGFEPTVPCGITGFQDQLHKPLGHPSVSDTFNIISTANPFVNGRPLVFSAACRPACGGGKIGRLLLTISLYGIIVDM